MVKEFEPIKEAQQDAVLATSLLERKARQRTRLEDFMLQSDSIDHALRANELIGLIPQKEAEYQAKLDSARATEQAKITEAYAKLDKMAGIPALAERHAAFRAELESIIAPKAEANGETQAEDTSDTEPAEPTARTVEIKVPRYTKGKTYISTLPNGTAFSTTSKFGERILATLVEGPATPQSLKESVGNGASSLITVLNRQLAAQGYRIVNEGPKGQTTYRLAEITPDITTQGDLVEAGILQYDEPAISEEDLHNPLFRLERAEELPGEVFRPVLDRELSAQQARLAASVNESIEASDSIPEADDWLLPGEITADTPTPSGEAIDLSGITIPYPHLNLDFTDTESAPAEDEASLLVALQTDSREKRGYNMTATTEMYRKRDLQLPDGTTIKDAPGIPASVVEAILAGARTKHEIAYLVYPEGSTPISLKKVTANLGQGVQRMLRPYGLSVKNLTSQSELRQGQPSNFQIVRLEENPEIFEAITSASLTKESTDTLEITDYEAGMVSNFFRDPEVINELTKLGIKVLTTEEIGEIQSFLPNIPRQEVPVNGEMNKIRANILAKLQDIYNQGLEADIKDRSGEGAGKFIDYIQQLSPEERNQMLAILTSRIRITMGTVYSAQKNGVILPESVKRQTVDLGPSGRPAQPGELLARPTRTRLSADERPVSMGIPLKAGADKPDFGSVKSPRDSRHRVLHTGVNLKRTPSQEPVYTDKVVAAGPEAIARARAEIIASTDLPRARVAQVEAGELRPSKKAQKRAERKERFPAEYDALLRFNPNSLRAIGKIVSDALTALPELQSKPDSHTGPARLVQAFSNLTTSFVDKSEELGRIKPTIEQGRKNYDLTVITRLLFYGQFDPRFNMISKRAQKQLESAIKKIVDARIAQIQSESASK